MEVEVVKEIEVNVEQIGPQGYSAYEVYVKNGGTLSETEWLASLKGNTGEKGEKGDTGSVKFIVVTELPTENIETDAIYIKPVQDPQEQNTYEEFIYVNNAWESLGTPKVEVDLSNYPTKDEVNNLLNNKVDKVDGKGLSTNDYTTKEKNKLAGIDLSTKQDILTAGDNITIENNIISASGGGSSTYYAEGDTYTNFMSEENIEVFKAWFDEFISTGISASFEIRTKVRDDSYSYHNFILVSYYNWSDSRIYMTFISSSQILGEIYLANISINHNGNNFTSITASSNNNYLDIRKFILPTSNLSGYLSKTNTTSYTPTSDYHPSTKKYVDDAIASAITTTLGGSY